MSGIWYYRQAGQIFGPVTFETLQQLARDGRLGKSDEIRTGSDPDWMIVSTVGTLRAATLSAPKTSPATARSPVESHTSTADKRVENAPSVWGDVLSQADNADRDAKFSVVGQTEDVNYYTRIEGDEAGPFSRPRVTRMFRDGTLAERDQIRSGERGEWMPIEVHPVFTAIRTATARPDTLPQTDAQYNAAGTASAPPAETAIDAAADQSVLSAAEESATGDSATGESATGESATGESATGESATGESATGESATGDSDQRRQYDDLDRQAGPGDDARCPVAGAFEPVRTPARSQSGGTDESAGADVDTPQPRRRDVSIPAWCYSTRALGITALSLAVFAAAYFLYPRQPPHPGVSGTVTLDGQPLANATMSFLPDDDQLEPSFARTDQKGNYALQQTEAVAGAMPGRYTVRITTYEPAVTESDPPEAGIPERVPTKYNIQTELAAEVKPVENNVIDFPLDSNGQIVQPLEIY